MPMAPAKYQLWGYNATDASPALPRRRRTYAEPRLAGLSHQYPQERKAIDTTLKRHDV